MVRSLRRPLEMRVLTHPLANLGLIYFIPEMVINKSGIFSGLQE